ncbi:histidinol-phosphate transaminase [Thermodesulfobacteriota bacterium]
MVLSVPKNILSIQPYSPGKPIEELEREYGISDSIKLASNENPLGPSPKAVEAIQEVVTKLNRYPDGSAYYLRQKLSQILNVPPESIILGNGSDEIIGMLAAAFLQTGAEVILPHSSFLMYDIVVRSAGATPVYVPLKSLTIDLQGIFERISSKTRMLFLTNPHNPTGTIISKKDFEEFLNRVPPEMIVVVDEAYIEFAREKICAKSLQYFNNIRNLVTLRTFSKAYGLAGIRIGYGIMPEEITGILNRIRQPFNVNTLAQIGAMAALDDDGFLKKTLEITHHGLDSLYDSLDTLGIKYFPSQTNFFLIDVQKNADQVFEQLLQEGVIVRSMTSYGFPEYIRVNVGLPEENVRFIKALGKILYKV